MSKEALQKSKSTANCQPIQWSIKVFFEFVLPPFRILYSWTVCFKWFYLMTLPSSVYVKWHVLNKSAHFSMFLLLFCFDHLKEKWNISAQGEPIFLTNMSIESQMFELSMKVKIKTSWGKTRLQRFFKLVNYIRFGTEEVCLWTQLTICQGTYIYR